LIGVENNKKEALKNRNQESTEKINKLLLHPPYERVHGPYDRRLRGKQIIQGATYGLLVFQEHVEH